jgi:hypothetical protein
VRVEQRQSAAVRLTAAEGPAVHGVVELQVSSQLVSGCCCSFVQPAVLTAVSTVEVVGEAAHKSSDERVLAGSST